MTVGVQLVFSVDIYMDIGYCTKSIVVLNLTFSQPDKSVYANSQQREKTDRR